MREFIVMGFDGPGVGHFTVCGNNLAVEGVIRNMLTDPTIKDIRVYDKKNMDQPLHWEARDVTYKKITFNPAQRAQ